MYVYFDRYGKIKEIISEPIRQGSTNNKIYVYFEGEPALTGVWWLEKKSNGDITTEKDIISNVVNKPLPYDLIKDRDLKYFKDYQSYLFYVIELGTTDLNVDGLTLLTIRATIDGERYAQGLLTFEIESSVVKYDNEITQSQYEYLLDLYEQVSNSNVLELPSKIGFIQLDENDAELTDEQLLEAQKDLCIIEYTSLDETKMLFYKNIDISSYEIIGFSSASEYYTTNGDNKITLVYNSISVNTSTKEIVLNNKEIDIYTQYRHLCRFRATIEGTTNDIYAIIICSDDIDFTNKKLSEIFDLTTINSISYYSNTDNIHVLAINFDYELSMFSVFYDDLDGNYKTEDIDNTLCYSDTITIL